MTQEEFVYYNSLEEKWKKYYNFFSQIHPEWDFEQKVKRVELQKVLEGIEPTTQITNEFLKTLFKKTDVFMKNHLSSELYQRIAPSFQKAISWLDIAIRKGIEMVSNGIDALLEKLFSIL